MSLSLPKPHHEGRDEANSLKEEKMVMCSGITELELETGYCVRDIEEEKAIRVTWVREMMMHYLYFCSFKCLHAFIHHSLWEQEEGK